MLDYAMVRVGGHVQGDLEAEPLRDAFKTGDVEEVPLFPFVYHEYGPVMLDGWTRLADNYGDIFYWIAAKTLLRGALLEVQYDFAPTELFPGMTGPGLQVVFPGALYEDATPENVDPAKVDFLGDVAAVRAGFAVPYLSYGRMERPLSLSPAPPDIGLDWFHPAGG
ncbi:MAG: hypothetical protein K8I02_05320, partial [Candidatus Methylomirabilis sp.]|nr:hypothetical protein [Deltaproteobacteria bacterium]